MKSDMRGPVRGAPFAVGDRVRITSLVDRYSLEHVGESFLKGCSPRFRRWFGGDMIDEAIEALIGTEGMVSGYLYKGGVGEEFPGYPLLQVSMAHPWRPCRIVEFALWPCELTAIHPFRGRLIGPTVSILETVR